MKMDIRTVVVLITTLVGVHGQDIDPVYLTFIAQKLSDKVETFLLKHTSDNNTAPPGLSEFCARDYARYIEALALGPAQWALEIMDSDGMPESGQASGNLVAEGMYTQCRYAHENRSDPDAIHGQYCLAWWHNRSLSIIYTQGLGFCVPHTCNKQDAEILLRADYASLSEDDQLSMNCVRDPVLADDPGAIVAITILSLFGFIVFVATIYHVIQNNRRAHPGSDHKTDAGEAQHNTNQETGTLLNNDNKNTGTTEGVALRQFRSIDPESIETAANTNNNANTDSATEESSKSGVLERLLLSFSLYVTIPKTVTAKHAPGSFQCLNGLRFLAMAWIVLGHTYALGPYHKTSPNLENAFDFLTKLSKPLSYTIHQTNLSVETFFIISGFLVTISFLKQLKRGNGRLSVVQWIMYYAHRYWRLTPVLMIVVMINTTLFRYFGNGPFMTEFLNEVDPCRTGWWKLLLYLQNFLYDNCLGHAWYLANDMQFYIIAPLFLCILYRNEIAGLIGLFLAFTGGLIANIVLNHQAYVEKTILDTFGPIYMKPWTRCTTYYMGMILGYIIYRTAGKVKVPKILVLLGWFVAISLCFVTVYANATATCSPAASNVCGPWTGAGEAAFRSLERPMFGLTVCWIIFACLTGNGGIFNTILSWTFFVPLAKLSYVGYLLHPILCYLFFYTSPVQVFYYDYFFVYLFAANILVTMFLSLAISAVFEVPFLGVEKVIFPSRK